MIQTNRTRSRREKSRRNGGTRRKAAKAMAAAAAIAGGTQTYAAPVRFENPPGPGHFTWTGPLNVITWLDVTQGPAGQPGAALGATSLGQGYNLFQGHPYEYLYGYVQVETQITPFGFYYAFPVPSGANVPTGNPFKYVSGLYYNYAGTVYSDIPAGVPSYLGIQFEIGTDVHFGWVGVVRTGRSVEAFAWGYETTPNTPIAAGAMGGGGVVPGDVNCDGVVNSADVPQFVQALVDPSAFTGCDITRADMNSDGSVDGEDIQRFESLLP